MGDETDNTIRAIRTKAAQLAIARTEPRRAHHRFHGQQHEPRLLARHHL